MVLFKMFCFVFPRIPRIHVYSPTLPYLVMRVCNIWVPQPQVLRLIWPAFFLASSVWPTFAGDVLRGT